ncbi:V-type ATP synthase subunit F [Candidatus Woesearchaeota archaeon]|nr:V-type ATP synthase subunit F [Candidatus Woesearchaeota archaeon]
MEIAVIGKEDFCLGFSLAGVRNIFETENPAEAIGKAFDDPDVGVVVVDESLMDKLDEFEKAKLEASVRPVFMTLSLKEESDALKKMIKKSIGVELW